MASNSFGARTTLKVGSTDYTIFKLETLEKRGYAIARLPFSIRVMLENVLRREDGGVVTADQIEAVAKFNGKGGESEVSFMPARVLLQDFTGVPVVADLAVMRDAIKRLGGDPATINPLQPVDLVIDHSVQVDASGTKAAFATNAELEFQRNRERYLFLRWGQGGFDNFRVVPPDTGIVHQVNLEFLAPVVFSSKDNRGVSRYGARHRFAYHDGQWAGRRRVGRRRYRGRSRDARALDADADSRRYRHAADRQSAAGRHGD